MECVCVRARSRCLGQWGQSPSLASQRGQQWWAFTPNNKIVLFAQFYSGGLLKLVLLILVNIVGCYCLTAPFRFVFMLWQYFMQNHILHFVLVHIHSLSITLSLCLSLSFFLFLWHNFNCTLSLSLSVYHVFTGHR